MPVITKWSLWLPFCCHIIICISIIWERRTGIRHCFYNWSTGGFSHKRPVIQSFDVFLCLKHKQAVQQTVKSQWMQTPWCSCNVIVMLSFVLMIYAQTPRVNTLRQGQNGHHFAEDIFKCIFLNENGLISIKISLNFVPKGSINNIPALVQIMAWCQSGDKPLSETMMVSLLTNILASMS